MKKNSWIPISNGCVICSATFWHSTPISLCTRLKRCWQTTNFQHHCHIINKIATIRKRKKNEHNNLTFARILCVARTSTRLSSNHSGKKRYFRRSLFVCHIRTNWICSIFIAAKSSESMRAKKKSSKIPARRNYMSVHVRNVCVCGFRVFVFRRFGWLSVFDWCRLHRRNQRENIMYYWNSISLCQASTFIWDLWIWWMSTAHFICAVFFLLSCFIVATLYLCCFVPLMVILVIDGLQRHNDTCRKVADLVQHSRHILSSIFKVQSKRYFSQ